MTIILASQSRSRAEVLRMAGVVFDQVPAGIDENEIKAGFGKEEPDPAKIAALLAERKALAVSAKKPADLIIGADQLLWFEEQVISKCANLAEAGHLLRRLRGKTHQLVGGIVLVAGGTVKWRHVSRVSLTMRDFTDAFLGQYLKREGEAVLEAVGCYRLEGLGAQLFDRIEGDYFSVLGLPLLPLLAALRKQEAIAA